MTELAMALLPFGVAAVLWVVLGHRCTMEHLRARRDGSLDRDAYKRGVRDGMLKAAKMVEADPRSDNHAEVIRAAATDE